MPKDFDPDETRFFVPSGDFHPIQLAASIRRQSDQLIDTIDYVVNHRASMISDNRGKISKDMIRAAVQTVFSYQEPKRIGELDTKQQRTVLSLVDDVVKGRREFVQFQLTRDCDGIKEICTSEILFFKT